MIKEHRAAILSAFCNFNLKGAIFMKNQKALGWGELIVGILFIVLGIYTFINPYTVLKGSTIVYGIFALVTGIMDIVYYVKLSSVPDLLLSCLWWAALSASSPDFWFCLILWPVHGSSSSYFRFGLSRTVSPGWLICPLSACSSAAFTTTLP